MKSKLKSGFGKKRTGRAADSHDHVDPVKDQGGSNSSQLTAPESSNAHGGKAPLLSPRDDLKSETDLDLPEKTSSRRKSGRPVPPLTISGSTGIPLPETSPGKRRRSNSPPATLAVNGSNSSTLIKKARLGPPTDSASISEEQIHEKAGKAHMKSKLVSFKSCTLPAAHGTVSPTQLAPPPAEAEQNHQPQHHSEEQAQTKSAKAEAVKTQPTRTNPARAVRDQLGRGQPGQGQPEPGQQKPTRLEPGRPEPGRMERTETTPLTFPQPIVAQPSAAQHPLHHVQGQARTQQVQTEQAGAQQTATAHLTIPQPSNGQPTIAQLSRIAAAAQQQARINAVHHLLARTPDARGVALSPAQALALQNAHLPIRPIQTHVNQQPLLSSARVFGQQISQSGQHLPAGAVQQFAGGSTFAPPVRRPQPPFSLLGCFLKHPELILRLSSILDVESVVDLYAISKPFQYIFNSHYTTYIRASAERWAPHCSYIFPWRCYSTLTIKDPVFRPLDRDPTKCRDVPGLKWLQMVAYRQEVCEDILDNMKEHGVPCTSEMAIVLKKIWFTMDLPRNGNRIGVLHNTRYWLDKEIFTATLFFLKLDMRFTDPVEGKGETYQRQLMLGCRNLGPLRNLLLGRSRPIQSLQLKVWYDYIPSPQYRSMNIMGVPPNIVGRGCTEGWGRGRERLIRVDEAVQKEGVRRGLLPQMLYLDSFLFGAIICKEHTKAKQMRSLEKAKETGAGEGEEGGRLATTGVVGTARPRARPWRAMMTGLL